MAAILGQDSCLPLIGDLLLRFRTMVLSVRDICMINFCCTGSVIGLVAQSSHPPFRRRPVPQPDGDEQSALLDPSTVDNEHAGDWIPPAPTSFALEALTRL